MRTWLITGVSSGFGKSMTELLQKFGCLDGMTQSNQMSLFV